MSAVGREQTISTPILEQIMKIRKNYFFLRILMMSLSLLPVVAVAAESTAVVGAREALEDFLIDWNASDLIAIQDHLNFPHVTHSSSNIIVAQSKGEFVQDFQQLRRQGWRRSTFDHFQVLQGSDNKVNFLVDFRRYDENDAVLFSGEVFYVVTRQDGTWGMQYRSGGPPPSQFSEAELDRIKLEATTAIYNFFAAFNAADTEALSEVNHVPQAMLVNDFFVYAEDRSSPLVNPDFPQMRENENWTHSTAEDIEVIHAMPGKVIFQLEFERFNTNGEKYAIVPALWVLTKVGDKWGIQYRSLMTPRAGELSNPFFNNAPQN